MKTTPAVLEKILVPLLRLNGTLSLGVRQYEALLTRFGTVEAIFRQTPAALQAARGVGPKTAERILDPASEEEAQAEIEGAKKEGFFLLPYTDPHYPEKLRSIHNPPLVLYVWGDPATLAMPLAIAIVGSRRASVYGKLQASKLSRELADLGFLIVSGLARGVDGAAHAGAIGAGGKTAAFLGSGLLRVYPSEHKKLAAEIARRGGAVASEFPLEARPLAYNFPRRNRLVSGLSLGVVVVEATERSGALSTASHAAEQGRDVFAVPGRIDSATSKGTHRLIRDGARLVESVEDILEELSPEARAVLSKTRAEAKEKSGGLSPEEEQAFTVLTEEPLHIDEIVMACGLPAAAVTAALTTLELKKRVLRLAGMLFVKAP